MQPHLITILNRSVGWGCQSGSETYSSASANYDNLAYSYPTFTITHSAGNIGGSNCYADTISGWGNITGLPKMAKNIFVVGATGSDGTLTGFSSRGPQKDGRILPNIVAPGDGGTSHATPNLAGVYAQLNQAYRYHNSGAIPQAGLLKAVIMNTADDMENPGPDFRTGYGSINGRRAYQVIRKGQIITSGLSQNANNTHSITVPANVKQLRVLVYWTDYPATPGITTKALVNDLDMVLTNPNAQTYQPWVLNPAFDIATLNNPAVRATDNLNNVEQITIDNPVAGNYTVNIAGTIVPQGPRPTFLLMNLCEEIVITHPHGGEKFVPTETERIRGDANTMLRFICPTALTTEVPGQRLQQESMQTADTIGQFHQQLQMRQKIRVQRGATIGESDTTFTIYEQMNNLQLIWSCADSSLFYWNDLQVQMVMSSTGSLVIIWILWIILRQTLLSSMACPPRKTNTFLLPHIKMASQAEGL
ncbi:MAG: S8 family serine peptidase [Bacteroidia bacterium]